MYSRCHMNMIYRYTIACKGKTSSAILINPHAHVCEIKQPARDANSAFVVRPNVWSLASVLYVFLYANLNTRFQTCLGSTQALSGRTPEHGIDA